MSHHECCGAKHPTKGTCNRLAGHAGRHHASGLGTLQIWSDAPRRCGCTGCLSGMECIDPYHAGGV